MSIPRTISCLPFVVAILWGVGSAIPSVAQESTGTFRGRMMLKGKVPPPAEIGQLPGGVVVRDESLEVDPKTAGIANVVVYAVKLPAGTEAPPAPVAPVVVSIAGGKFVPHVLGVRVGQSITVTNATPNTHSFHANPLRNVGVNLPLAPAAVATFTYNKAERLPVKVVNDIAPWMQHYELVVDHPWFAVTDPQGDFSIEELPSGQYEFAVWHEKAGYLERNYPIAVVAGGAIHVTEVYAADLFSQPGAKQ